MKRLVGTFLALFGLLAMTLPSGCMMPTVKGGGVTISSTKLPLILLAPYAAVGLVHHIVRARRQYRASRGSYDYGDRDVVAGSADRDTVRRVLNRGDSFLRVGAAEKSAYYYAAIVSNPRIMASDGDIPVGFATVDIRHRKHAEDGLRRLGCDPALVYEQILAKEKDEHLLLMSVKSLERVGRAESLEILKPFQKHEKPAYRRAADRSVRRIRRRLELESRAGNG